MKKLNILVVDDIFTNRLLLSEILAGIGHDTQEAENGQIALDKIMEQEFDLVFMDIEMPVMNGLETTETIRNTFTSPKNKIPIIALTAHNPNLFFDDYLDVGFDQLLTKPYSIEKITKMILQFSG